MMVSREMGFSSDTGNPRIINCLKQFVFLLIMFKTLIQLNSTVDTLLLKYTFYLVSWFILNIYKTALWLNENSTQCYYIFIAARVIFKCTDVIISSHIVFVWGQRPECMKGPVWPSVATSAVSFLTTVPLALLGHSLFPVCSPWCHCFHLSNLFSSFKSQF